MLPFMLEDDFTYVLRKAMTGHGVTPADLAKRSGVPEPQIATFLAGDFSADIARRLAPALRLDPEAFACHAIYQPLPVKLPAIERLDLPFGAERVNAWLVNHHGDRVLFDAGFHAADLLRAMKSTGMPVPGHAFITHAHRDHTGAIGELLELGIVVHAAQIAGTTPMAPGDAVTCGALTITATDLSGHARPALGFHVGGLALPVLVTGDAVFAGSIGSCPSPPVYQHALQRLVDVLTALSDDTILLPGHGPATTLGEERRSNPFLRAALTTR